MSTFLQEIIPSNNRIEVAFARTHNGAAKGNLLEGAYNAGFIGAFKDQTDQPTWARRAARYLRDDFHHNTPGTKKRFSDVASQLADGDGESLPNCRHALELWAAGGKPQPEPFSCYQDYGSCVDASCSEHETAMFGWRAARSQFNETFIHSAAWYKYADRGYCSDGWSGSGIAAVARRVGCAFRTKYQLPGGEIDFTDDDQNENIVARQWCRSGIPSWLKTHTQTNHGYQDGAITEYDGDHRGFLKVLKAGGVLHAGGVRTSGGSKPFTRGSTGAHMQSTCGADDSEACRKWFKDTHNITWEAGDFPLINMQTWGAGWRGECADQYWPTQLWGPKPQGAWVCSAKWWLSDVEYAWLPWAKGFPGTGPVPLPPHPPLAGTIYAEQAGQVIAVRGEIQLVEGGKTFAYIIVPDGAGKYRPVPKPVL